MKYPMRAAAAHLRAGEIEACHRLVQDDESPDANYLHALVHRHDGDFSNALYWYRRVGSHPVIAKMSELHPGWLFEKLDAASLAEEVRLLADYLEEK